MTFTIPNVGDALFASQAMVNSRDFDILVAGISGASGIASGCAVTTTGAANGSVTVAVGTVLIDGVYVPVVAGNVAITSNASGNPRRDLITVDNTGAKSTVIGTPGAVPLMPAIPTDRTVLADVYVPNGHTGTSTILGGQITDKRVFAPASDFEGHNVLQYGARGDSNHSTGGGTDDTQAFQDAYDAAQAAGGFGVVVIPGGRTYLITDTIYTKPNDSRGPVWTWGVGAFGNGGIVLLPTVVWGGAVGGTMFATETAVGSNIPGALYRNVRLTGRKIANTAIRFGPTSTNSAALDTGTGLDEVHVADLLGDAIVVDSIGATNFWIRGGRWDQIDGYGLRMKVHASVHLSMRDITWDNWLGAEPGHGKGWVHFDASGAPAGSSVTCHVDTCKLEVNADLLETNADGSIPAHKRGVIACTIAQAQGNVQFHLTLTNVHTPVQTGNSSGSLIQMLGGDGTEANKEVQRSARLNVNARMLRGSFGGTEGAATGHWIPIGGIPTAHRSTFTGGTYNSLVHAPTTGSDVFSTERPRIWSYTS